MASIGIVEWFSPEKGFGFIKMAGVGVFVHKTKVPAKFLDQMVKGASVSFSFNRRYMSGETKTEVAAIYSVEAPKGPVTVLDTVTWFDEKKNFGFVNCGQIGVGVTAFLHRTIANRAVNSVSGRTEAIIPGAGMPVKAVVLQEGDKYKVVSFEWGKKVEAEYHALYGSDEAKGATPVAKTQPVAEATTATAETTTTRKHVRAGGKKARAAKAAEAQAEAAPAKLKRRKVPATVAEAISSADGDGSMADALKAAAAKANGAGTSAVH